MWRRLLYINGLATLAVVLNHARVWGVIAMYHWTHRYRQVSVPNYDQAGSLEDYVLLSTAGAIQFAIPSFLFVSGCYVAIATGHTRSTLPWSVVRARVRVLAIPYVIWCLIMSGVMALDGERYSLSQYVRLYLTGYVQGPYYFVPMLIQLYVLAPLIVPFAKAQWKRLLAISAVIHLVTQVPLYAEMFQVSCCGRDVAGLPIWLGVTRAFWFVLGIIVGVHMDAVTRLMERVRWMSLAVAMVCLVMSTIEQHVIAVSESSIPVETTIGSVYALAVICAILGFADVRLPFKSQVERIGSMSFGIYLTHAAVQQYGSRVSYHVVPGLLEYALVFTGVIVAVGLGIPVLLMELARRSPLRRYYRCLFG